MCLAKEYFQNFARIFSGPCLFLKVDTAEKESVFGVILVRVFSEFFRIWIEYGEIRSNPGKMRTRITTNTDSFYAV